MITCTFEKGWNASLRHVTVDALFVDGEKILLVKRATHLLEAGKYCLPGGYLDRDENLIEGILREVIEETGYEGVIPQLFRINDNPYRRNEDRQNVSFIFIIKKGNMLSTPDDEVTEVKWFHLNELPHKDEVAFDHYETIEMYKKYVQKKFNIPFIGDNNEI